MSKMLSQRTLLSIFLPLALAASACAHPTEVVIAIDIATENATILKADWTDFAAQRNAMRADDEEFLRLIENQSLRSRQSGEASTSLWEIRGTPSDKQALSLLKSMRESDAQIKKDPFGKSTRTSEVLGVPGKTFAKIKVDLSVYDEIISQYAKMKERRSPQESVSFLLGFAQEVQSELAKIEQSKSEENKKGAKNAAKSLP